MRLTVAVTSLRLMPASMIASNTVKAFLEIDGLRSALRSNYRTPVEKDFDVVQSQSVASAKVRATARSFRETVA